jgi:hypothetical protein
MAAFRDNVLPYAKLGLAPVPVGGREGKTPLIKGYTNALVTVTNVAAFALRFGSANIALLTGASRLAIVDVDDADLVPDMLHRFGPTPLIVRSPGRGGMHLYYRHADGVAPFDLRDSEFLPVEIKAGKNIVVVPPSVNPGVNPVTHGRHYEFVKGTFDRATLNALPPFRLEALRMGRSPADVRRVLRGERNNWLFRQCLRAALSGDSFDDLLDYAQTRNDECDPVLDDDEVQKIAASAWGYTLRGANFAEARYW